MPGHRDQNVENAQDAQKTILLVEDDAAIAELLVQMITQETIHRVLAVPDGPQALACVRDIKPHLLILDYRLPTMHGIELYDRLHTTEGLERIPIIMISANVPQNEIKRRQIMFMRKPFDIYTLLEAIKGLLM
jgi:CheY-like chemotaxis protein